MAETLYRTILHLHVEMRKDRVGRIRLVGAKQTFAAEDVHVMAMLCAALCQHQIVVAIFLVDVRPFGISASKTYAQMMYLTKLLACLYINLADLDIALFPQEVTLTAVEE